MIRDLFNTYREAFRIWVRSKTRQKSIYEAEENRLFWSKCYLLSALGIVGVYLFQSRKERINFNYDKDLPKPLGIAKAISESDSVRFIKYTGFKRVADEVYSIKEVEQAQNLKEQETPALKVS